MIISNIYMYLHFSFLKGQQRHLFTDFDKLFHKH